MAVTEILAIANLLIGGAQSLAASGSNKELTAEEIALQKEATITNRDLMQGFLDTTLPGLEEQQRTEFEKGYDDIYKNLTQAWGGQAASVSAADQEGGSGTSAQAIIDVTKSEIAYNFGDDLEKDMDGGLYALAKQNMENQLADVRKQLEAQIDIADRAVEYYDLAAHENDETFWEKLGEGLEELFPGSTLTRENAGLPPKENGGTYGQGGTF